MRRVIAHGFAALVLFVLCRLGLWQLERAEFKAGLAADAARAAAAAPVDLAGVSSPRDALWRTVRVDPDNIVTTPIWLLDNRVHDGQPGYEVFIRYATADRALLLSAGWVGPFLDRERVPSLKLELPRTPLLATVVPLPGTTVGGLTRPGPPEQLDATLWRVQSLMQLTGGETSARLPRPDPQVALIAADPLVAGARRHLPEPRFTAAKHRAYAVQWFIMAAIFLPLYLWAQFFRGNRPAGAGSA